jgi:hypothetical protein
LLRGEPEALGFLHGLNHVHGELTEAVVDLFHTGTGRAQSGMVEGRYFKNHG